MDLDVWEDEEKSELKCLRKLVELWEPIVDAAEAFIEGVGSPPEDYAKLYWAVSQLWEIEDNGEEERTDKTGATDQD